jgi:anti-anti-sigma regulatory factor
MTSCGPYGLTNVDAPEWEPAPDSTEVLVLGPAIDPDSVPALCERLADRVRRRRVTRVVCDVGAITEPDAAVLGALARLRLTTRRLGCLMEIQRAQPRLRELIAFAGLDEALPVRDGGRVQPVRQAEQREQRRGVEEVVDRLDPAG